MVHAIVAQVLLDWCATATGQTRSDVIQRLALPISPPVDSALTPLATSPLQSAR